MGLLPQVRDFLHSIVICPAPVRRIVSQYALARCSTVVSFIFVLIDFDPKKSNVKQSRKHSATMSTSDVNPGFPSGPKNIVFRAVQSHYLLEFRALLLCARFATGR
jgi:hypothetical protein